MPFAQPLMQLLRASACLGAPLLRPLERQALLCLLQDRHPTWHPGIRAIAACSTSGRPSFVFLKTAIRHGTLASAPSQPAQRAAGSPSSASRVGASASTPPDPTPPSSSSSCPSPRLCCSCYGLQPSLAPPSFVRWLTPSPSTSLPHPPHRPARRRASASAPRPPCSATPLRHVQRAAGTPASVQRHSSPACSTSSRHPGQPWRPSPSSAG